jgi:hypothetical protein
MLIIRVVSEHMDPDHLEWLLFLKANKILWLSIPQLIQDILDNTPAGDGARDANLKCRTTDSASVRIVQYIAIYCIV